MSTIAYDKPVADFIAGLNATGHVTHTSWRKKSVTFHHNAGRLTLQGILDVWKVRPASAHFQVDRSGSVGQYVKVDEYAWACGNRTGNQESISIEMANETLSPEWQVNDVTLKEAARLAGWLFANVIKAAPTKDNVFMHSHWLATSCAGPWVKARFANVLADVQAAYAEFTKPVVVPPPVTSPTTPPVIKRTRLTVDGDFGPATRRATQQWLKDAYRSGVVVDGEWGPASAMYLELALNYEAKKRGWAQPPITKTTRPGAKSLFTHRLRWITGMPEVVGGWGTACTKALQTYLNTKGA